MSRIAPALIALAVTACAPSPAPANGASDADATTDASGIRYHAHTLILESFPVQLRTVVTLTNTTPAPRTVELPGGCPVLLRAYRTPEHTGEPAWDQSREAVCTLQLMIVRLAPGESQEVTGSATARDVLGDSLPNGRYYLTAVVRPDQQRIEIPAGEADLAQ